MRGKRTLYTELVTDAIEVPKYGKERRGRSQELIEKRNLCLAYRYCFHVKIRELKYEETLNLLSAEFFLAPRSISAILIEQHSVVKKVQSQINDIEKLQQLFPSFLWQQSTQIITKKTNKQQ